jgi:hypothetical protein
MTTELLVHSDDTDGSTDFIDSSDTTRTVTGGTGVEHSTDQAKFGQSAIYMPGGQGIEVADSPDWATGSADFWGEAWYYIPSGSFNIPFFGQVVDNNNRQQVIYNNGSGQINTYIATSSIVRLNANGNVTIPREQWVHIGWGWTTTEVYFYINGVRQSLVVSTSLGSVGDISAPLIFGKGRLGGSNYYLPTDTYVDEIRVIIGDIPYPDNFTPPDFPYGRDTVEKTIGLVISLRTEKSIGLDLPISSNLEQLRQLRVATSRRAERAINLLIDISTLYEKALRLPITGYIGREAFQRLRISGALAQLEQYKDFTIADFDRVYCEAFQRFSIYAGLAGLVKEIGVTLFINGSAIPFETGSGGDREGVYFKVYEFTTPYNDLIRSLPDPTKSRPSAQIAWASEIKTDGGSQIVFDWVIELILDSITVSRVTDQGTKHTSEEATIRLVSPTAALGWLDGNLGAAPITASWPSGTMATTILDDIFPDSLTYDLQLDDFPIGQQIDANELYPNEIIPLFCIECVIHTANDGTMIIRNRPEVRGAVTPVHDISHSDYEMSAVDSDDQGQYRPNVIRIANFQEANSSQTLPAPEIVVDEDDQRKAVIYAYPVPFRQVWLRTSRIPSTGFTTNSGLSQTIQAGDGQGELVEFLEGKATASRPITGGFDSIDYGSNADLGTVTPNEDGTITSAINSRSLAVAKYSTKRYAFDISLAGAISSVSGGDGTTTVQDDLGNSIQLWFVDQEDL